MGWVCLDRRRRPADSATGPSNRRASTGTTTGYGTTRYATPTQGNAPVLLDGELRISQLARAAVVIIGIYYLWSSSTSNSNRRYIARSDTSTTA